jgi:hypothetical protein
MDLVFSPIKKTVEHKALLKFLKKICKFMLFPEAQRKIFVSF